MKNLIFLIFIGCFGISSFSQTVNFTIINKTPYPITIDPGARASCPPSIGTYGPAITLPPFSQQTPVPPVYSGASAILAVWVTAICTITVPNVGTTVAGSSNPFHGCSIIPGFGSWSFGPSQLNFIWSQNGSSNIKLIIDM